MSIDITEFLKKHSDNENSKKISQKKDKPINLDFEKEVEDKLSNLKIDADTKDFNFLKRAYFDVKRFDEDLPNKFLGIEEIGNNILKDLGNLYSKKFLENLKINITQLKIFIENNLKILDLKLKSNNFNEMLDLLNKLLLDHKSIPNHFLKTKSELFIEIKKREILINNKIKSYNNLEIKKIKFLISKKIRELEKSYFKLTLKELEEVISNLNNLSEKIPKLMHSKLVDEKLLISNFLIKSQNFLFLEYEKEFKRKELIMNNLIEKFHKLNIEKDLDNLLVIYNQLIFAFESLPEVFFEKKVHFFTKINELYGSINNLIIKNNMSKFYETYNSGKTLEEVEDYLSHVISNKIINKDNLIKIKEKLDSVPEKYLFEKKDLNLKLLKLLNSNEISNNKNSDNSFNQVSNKLLLNDDTFKNNLFIEKKSSIFLDKYNIENNLKKEINIYYNKIEDSINSYNIQIYYEKILFYLKISRLDDISKKAITINLNKLINSKNLN